MLREEGFNVPIYSQLKLGNLESSIITRLQSRMLGESGNTVELLDQIHYVQESEKGGFFVYASERQLEEVECHDDCDMFFIVDANGIALNIDGNIYDEEQYSQGVVQALAENVLASDGLASDHTLKIEAVQLITGHWQG